MEKKTTHTPGSCFCEAINTPEGPLFNRCPLHAAAPELLAELKLIISAYEDEITKNNEGAPIMSQRVTRARAAILRAEGSK